MKKIKLGSLLPEGVELSPVFPDRKSYDRFVKRFSAKMSPILKSHAKARAESELASHSHYVD